MFLDTHCHRPGRLARASLWAILLVAGLATPIQAANPRDDLLRLVPDDVGFCLVVTDVRGQAKQFRELDWVKAFEKSPLTQKMAQAPEARKLIRLKEQLEKRLKVPLARLRDDIFGDAVIFAYKPGPPGQPDQDQGLLLLWARDPRLLAKVIDVLNADLKERQERLHHKVKYFRRLEARGTSNYYYLNGSTLVFSFQESMLQQVIDRSLNEKIRTADSRVLAQLRRLGFDKALAVLWFNPRAFDLHVKKSIEATKGLEAVIGQALLRYWQALEGAGLALVVSKNIELKLAVRARTDKLPAAIRRFFDEPTRPSKLWNRFPSNALFAFAGQIDATALAQFLGEFIPAKTRKSFLADLNRSLDAGFGLQIKDILPQIGPDIGLCVTSPRDKETLFPYLTMALRVHPGPKKPHVDQALFNGLNSLALLAVLSYNSSTKTDSLRLKSVMQEQIEVKYLENDKLFPAGFKPAFALKEGYLLLTTSPEAVREFKKTNGVSASSSAGALLLRISLKEWKQFLGNRRKALIDYASARDKIAREKASQQMDAFLWALGLFDHLELHQRTGSGQVTWTLTMHPAVASKK
jgi:hypothetical protein